MRAAAQESRSSNLWLGLFVVSLLAFNTTCSAAQTWFDEQVTWKYGKDGKAWSTPIKDPLGHEEYQLTLRPLWALEGGVIAVEIVLSRPATPNVNLLGERQNGVDSPFVITVRELQNGIAKSKFGAAREFQVDRTDMRVMIKSFRLGHGVGSLSTNCKKCNNIQKLSMRISIQTGAN